VLNFSARYLALIPECIAQMGNKWHGAHNKATIVVSLFEHTPQGDVEMLYIKETVFGVRNGAQLIDSDHPCLVELATTYKGACYCVSICKIC
jgi:hypothetical protein